MEMADNPKLDLTSREPGGSEEHMGTSKISVLDHIKEFQYTTEKSDNFVIDMESFSHGGNKDVNSNSRITLQRSFSRKGSQRGSEKKNSNPFPKDRETLIAASLPRGPSTPEKATVAAVGKADHSSSPPAHHQISITTGNINAATEGRCTTRRNSLKRPLSSWLLDPKRVLFFFATLSSIGTMLLIYFTLTVGKINPAGDALD